MSSLFLLKHSEIRGFVSICVRACVCVCVCCVWYLPETGQGTLNISNLHLWEYHWAPPALYISWSVGQAVILLLRVSYCISLLSLLLFITRFSCTLIKWNRQRAKITILFFHPLYPIHPSYWMNEMKNKWDLY